MSLTKVSYSMIQGASINVLDFGAVGDGVTDSTSAIQAAIDYALSTTNIGEVVIPFGVYMVTAPITIGARTGYTWTSALKIRGLAPSGNAQALNTTATIKADTGFSGAFVLGSNRTYSSGYKALSLEFENISIDSSQIADVGLLITDPINVYLKSVHVIYSKDINIHLNGVTEPGYSVNVSDGYVYGGSPAGTAFPSNYGIKSTARFTMFNRVVIDGSKTGLASSGDTCVITNCQIEGQATSLDLSTAGGGLNRVTNCLFIPYGAGESNPNSTFPANSRAIYIKSLGTGAALNNVIAFNNMSSAIGDGVAIEFDGAYLTKVQDNTIIAPIGIRTNASVLSFDRQWNIVNNTFNGAVAIDNLLSGAKIYFGLDNIRSDSPSGFSFTGQPIDFLQNPNGKSYFLGLDSASVSTTPETIYTFTNINGPGMIQVAGVDGSSNQFCDLVMIAFGKIAAVVSSNNVFGSPAVRTYDVSSANVRLAMASGTYTVRTNLIDWRG